MVLDKIDHWAKSTPVKIALRNGEQNWTYRDFAVAVAVARGFFVRRGVTGAGIVVLVLPDICDFWVIALALQSLGLTTIAVPTADDIGALDLPDLRLVVAMARDVSALADVCARRGLKLLAVSLEGEAPLPVGAVADHPPGGHILRTSGTTGEQKHILDDAAFVEKLAGPGPQTATFAGGPEHGISSDCVVQLFDFGPWTGTGYRRPLAIWAVGGTVVVQQRHPLFAGLRHADLTHAVAVPTMLIALLQAPPNAYARNERLKLSIAGGTISVAALAAAKLRITPHISNWLGSTETGIFAVTPFVTADDHRWHRVLPGRVVEIVDELDRPVAEGETGRLRINTGWSEAYFHDEAATRTFFHDGFFYPGDLAVGRSDGRIALQGRVTDVINVAGQKLSPVPIEDRLRDAIGVSDLCLFSMQNDLGEEELHIAIESREPVDIARLAEALRPESVVFGRVYFYYIAPLPRNAGGKLMRGEVRARALAMRRA